MSKVESGCVHRGGKGGGGSYTDCFERMQRIEGRERGHEAQFSKDLQTLLFGHLCLAALNESKIKSKARK